MASPVNRSSSSPKWIRPIEVFSLRRKARRASTVLQPLDGNTLPTHPKISNPFSVFGKLPQKRKIDYVYEDCTENSNSFDAFALIKKSSAPSEPVSKPKPPSESDRQLPLDWSLKSRVRFMSHKPFPYRGSLKTSEEASGTTGFVRCLHSQKVQECSVDTSANARFHQQCLVWQHPSLPWLKLFPRLQETNQGQSSGFANDSAIQDALFTEWCESLRSLFQLVRARQCPFFYLCGQSFTVLFRAAGIGGLPDTHALLTPTTSGLRKLIKSQGIEFTMPSYPKQDSQESDAEKTDQENMTLKAEDDKEDEEEEEEPEEFLESLGLSQQDLPTFNAKRRKIEQDGHREGDFDGKRESLICLEGPEAQTLLSLLTSSQGRSLCVSHTGHLAGIPPTLLSPCAFRGAALTRIKARQGWVKQGEKNMHCVDLSGPILPNMVHGLATLFTDTQDGDFTAVLASDLGTTGFTSVRPDKDTFASCPFASENLKDCGLSADFRLCLCTSAQRAVVHELLAKDGLFSWS